eukprot:1158307-Pelagomonas_calceolata.AAC.5
MVDAELRSLGEGHNGQASEALVDLAQKAVQCSVLEGAVAIVASAAAAAAAGRQSIALHAVCKDSLNKSADDDELAQQERQQLKFLEKSSTCKTQFKR